MGRGPPYAPTPLRGRQGLDPEGVALLLGLPEVVLELLGEPALGGGVEGEGEARGAVDTLLDALRPERRTVGLVPERWVRGRSGRFSA